MKTSSQFKKLASNRETYYHSIPLPHISPIKPVLTKPSINMTTNMKIDLDNSIYKSKNTTVKPLKITCEIPLWVKKHNDWIFNNYYVKNKNIISQIKKDLSQQKYALIRQDPKFPIKEGPMNLAGYEEFMKHIMKDQDNTRSSLIEYGPQLGDFCVLDRPLYPGTKHIYKTGIDTLNLSRQHNELGYGDIWPKYISFLCITPPVPGQGITTLSSGKQIALSLQEKAPDLMNRLLLDGVQYIQMYLSDKVKHRECALQGPEDYCHVAPTWSHSFGTNDKNVALDLCRKHGGWDNVELHEDDNIVVSRVRPVFLELENIFFFFNAIVGFSKRPFREVTHGNGEPFTVDEINLLEELQQDSLIGINYRKGDILIVDNEKMMHGRSVRDMSKPREIAVVKGGIRKRNHLEKTRMNGS